MTGKEYEELTTEQKVDYWLGQIAMGIGHQGHQGVRSKLWALINSERDAGYRRGHADGMKRERAKKRIVRGRQWAQRPANWKRPKRRKHGSAR
jgi:hypothetical protein